MRVHTSLYLCWTCEDLARVNAFRRTCACEPAHFTAEVIHIVVSHPLILGPVWIRDFFFPDEASVHTYQLTGQTLPFRNENFTITQNYPARSVKS